MNSVGVETTDQDIRDKYKELFNGEGLLNGYELKLNVDTSDSKPDSNVRI